MHKISQFNEKQLNRLKNVKYPQNTKNPLKRAKIGGVFLV